MTICDNCIHDDVCGKEGHLDEAMIFCADEQPVNQWISCKDKMPDDGVNVLISTGNKQISLAWYDSDRGRFYICDSDYNYNLLDVSHWQPLPEPPKDGDTE